ncbi:MAG: phosphoenolpyruvate carboxykinase (ATP) [Candidatus Cloacimonetes bacterium]|nr:phosphoenolpyruvate carboxykinase (ATP) [Candidatus Cloacimonadota bacterium]
MSSKSSMEYYPNLKEISPIRAMAKTILLNHNVRRVTAAQAYEMAQNQPGVSRTDMPIYPPAARRLGLPEGAMVLNDCHGQVIGRTAKARRFYNRMDASEKRKVEGDLREAIYQLQHYDLICAEAVLGLDPDLMIRAHYVTTSTDAMNVFNWLVNFMPFELVEDEYNRSKPLPIKDIIIVAFNEWSCDDPFYHCVGQPQLALVDEQHNVIFNLGMRYFGERKKGTLTLAWTSGMRLGMAASHGGIKEIDFSQCTDEKFRKLKKSSIAFYGLSGTGKSSHTNSHDNGGTLPEGFKKVVLHDDAFQIDPRKKVCRVWEPSLFDKTDSRDLDHPDWKYCLSVMNHSLIQAFGRTLPLGMDVRNANGRALIDRDLLGEWVNRCSFPKALVWLMKDICLPPALKFSDKHLAVAMGAALMTKRSRAENVTEEELKKLVFEPFANPFRVYELHKDVEAFLEVIDSGAEVYTFNSTGFWKCSEAELEDIPLQTSLTLQTLILTEQIEWEPCGFLPGALVPTKDSIDPHLPGYYERYSIAARENPEDMKDLMRDRFKQRRKYLFKSDLQSQPQLLKKLLHVLHIEAEEVDLDDDL